MKIKAFTAKSMQEAMQEAKLELGAEAVILHTRHVKKGGFLGFFRKDMVEVMAAVEEQQDPKPRNPNSQAALTANRPQMPEEPKKYVSHQRSANAYQAQQRKQVDSQLPKEEQFVEFQQELEGVKQILEQVIGEDLQNKVKSVPLLDHLLEKDFDLQVAKKIVASIDDEAVKNAAQSEGAVDALAAYFSEVLIPAKGIELRDSGPKIVALIGATGVGKTTTLAKIAANFVLEKNCKLALITADTYRISAVEQLKTYSDIIGVPLEIVYSPKELKEAIQKHWDKQLILIDTAGRSQHNEEQLAELVDMLAVSDQIEKHLVISSTTKYKDAVDIVQKFSLCSPDRLLFTKVDETNAIGTLISVLHKFPITLSYLTNGQSVPDDIVVTSARNLAEWTLRE